ncbi:MAG TPA: protein-disulfide reductase DsbD N-terminal domain-containing protein [Candidatus Sulfopaludibacter sp.]|jgi:thiol:disulfide interchange protein DsbD|nr:protein-disulfide reductase DsbD N-terminal domain-containing protein [Candidatus Sulfopaludibacter sp.]
MKILLCAGLLALSLAAAAPDPVAWKLQDGPTKPVRAGGKFTIKLTAQIQEGWHLYSTKHVEEGPVATKIWVPEGQPFQLSDAIKSSPPDRQQDPSFNMEVELYEGQASFTLPVKVSAGAPAGVQNFTVNASYQSCNNKICLPPKTVKVEVAVSVVK